MKQEIEIPSGYEFDHIPPPILGNGGGAMTIILKKIQVKDFDWYVDQYMHTSPTTSDEIINWLTDSQINTIGNTLKKREFNLLPWEIKIGLFKFICDAEKGSSYGEVKCIVHGKTSRLSEFADKYLSVIPKELIEDLTKTK